MSSNVARLSAIIAQLGALKRGIAYFDAFATKPTTKSNSGNRKPLGITSSVGFLLRPWHRQKSCTEPSF